MTLIETCLKQTSPLIVDGAMGTELERQGADINDPLWSARLLAEAPEMIKAVHKKYLEAGADIIITASYQASYEGFMKRGMDEAAAERLIRSSISLAQEAVLEFWEKAAQTDNRIRPLVAASIGPYGAFLADGSEFRGNYNLSEQDLMTFHKKRLATLVAVQPDLLACETIPCLAEARALCRLLADFPSSEAWVSFSAKNGQFTNNGERLSECAAFLDTIPQVTAVGINCTAPQHIPSLIREIQSATGKPVIIYPNKGGIYDPLSKDWAPDPALPPFDRMAAQWAEAGAGLIGGCCQTSPGDIKQITSLFRSVL